ncbi:hypothetical protein GCM10027277_31370 [Pseudoduganella ginsengisoli]|uniref:Acyltransferase family protein n=1 Tax=Pseudoduganella ginsengisoli TaxID=1462440 RepID=A0A6L6PZW6_9BURK|nr:acyltransferase [Pseudoduganella ginsengisoli]MTW02548.1 acyltransferase family protein [Pseudoduganella ginsengisoli]
MQWLAGQFELSRHANGRNLRPMEGLRGFAVFLVFLVHYATLISPWASPGSKLAGVLDIVHAMGNAGVDLFFVLSGYLIYGSLIARPQPFLPFMWRRVVRIYPAFCAVFALYLALSFLRPEDSKIPSAPLAAAIYVLQNFLLLPGLFSIKPIITVAWSLSYEMFYYIAMPFVIGALGLRRRSSAVRVALFAVAATAIAGYCLLHDGHVRLIMFIGGILLHEALRKPPVEAPHSSASLFLLAGALAMTTLPIPGAAGYTAKIVTLFFVFPVVCYTCLLAPRAWLTRAFCWTPLRWLGNMSYSYYLMHGLGLKFGFLVLARVMPHAAHESVFAAVVLPVMFVLTLLPSAALFLLVERPFSLATPVKQGGQVLPQQMQA